MSVTISVSQVRRALFLGDAAADARGEGSPSTTLLGQWFHEGLAFLVADGSGAGPLSRLAGLDADLEVWKQAVADQVYTQFVGPRLTKEQAALRAIGPQVMSFWQAMQAASHWLAELSWSLRSHRPSKRLSNPPPWQTLAECFSTEEPLSFELREPGWSDSVRLVGIADAVVRLNSTGAWCAVEFKLGQTSPAVDLGQACLYHMMLSAIEAQRGEPRGASFSGDPGALALVTFRPERHERLFDSAELKDARSRLIELIGKLADVVGSPAAIVEPPPRTAVPTEETLELGRKLVATLVGHRVEVTLQDPIVEGPTFIRFHLEPSPSTKVNAVTSRAKELQVGLRLEHPPLIGMASGRLVVDVQRPKRQFIHFRDVIEKIPPRDPATGGAHIPIGVDLSNRLVCADLSKPEHAHLLAAGTTGSGKSEWLRVAVAGLIATNTPDTLRLVVIDPKRNAFHALRESPFLWKPIVFPDEHDVVAVLIELVDEMQRRYRIAEGADSFVQLAERSDRPLPRIVCVCDEFRDLLIRDRQERKAIEQQISRLGAKARAAGIHLILATQQPSRETITGPIDANLPAHVGLKMGKSLESQMLLGESGAECLLGNGDLFFKDIGSPRRLQAPLLSPEDRESLFGPAAKRNI